MCSFICSFMLMRRLSLRCQPVFCWAWNAAKPPEPSKCSVPLRITGCGPAHLSNRFWVHLLSPCLLFPVLCCGNYHPTCFMTCLVLVKVQLDNRRACYYAAECPHALLPSSLFALQPLSSARLSPPNTCSRQAFLPSSVSALMPFFPFAFLPSIFSLLQPVSPQAFHPPGFLPSCVPPLQPLNPSSLFPLKPFFPLAFLPSSLSPPHAFLPLLLKRTSPYGIHIPYAPYQAIIQSINQAINQSRNLMSLGATGTQQTKSIRGAQHNTTCVAGAGRQAEGVVCGP